MAQEEREIMEERTLLKDIRQVKRLDLVCCSQSAVCECEGVCRAFATEMPPWIRFVSVFWYAIYFFFMSCPCVHM